MILRNHLCPLMHTLTKRADFVKVSEILVDVSQICKRVISLVELTILTIFIYSYNFLDNLGKISLESSLLPNSSFPPNSSIFWEPSSQVIPIYSYNFVNNRGEILPAPLITPEFQHVEKSCQICQNRRQNFAKSAISLLHAFKICKSRKVIFLTLRVY